MFYTSNLTIKYQISEVYQRVSFINDTHTPGHSCTYTLILPLLPPSFYYFLKQDLKVPPFSHLSKVSLKISDNFL